MDSVFANCTDDELAFDIMFDNEDSLIDIVAGVDESGELVTGPNPTVLDEAEADKLVGENPDFDYQKDGDAAYDVKDAEGTKEVKPEVGGEVGDGKEVSGKENSAESKADNVTPEIDNAIGANDKQQTALEDASEGPIEDDDVAERNGEVSAAAVPTDVTADVDVKTEDAANDVPADAATAGDPPTGDDGEEISESAEAPDVTKGGVAIGSSSNKRVAESAPDVTDDEKEIVMDENMFEKFDEMIASIKEEVSKCPCCGQVDCDCAARAGEAKVDTDNVEGASQEVIGAAISDKKVNYDPIEDCDDKEVRDGETCPVVDIEGEKVRPVGAALEAAEESILKSLEAAEALCKEIEAEVAEDIVPDDVREGDSSNKEFIRESEESDLVNDLDDDDMIDIIDNDLDEKILDKGTSDVESGYDDDELIDLVLSDD